MSVHRGLTLDEAVELIEKRGGNCIARREEDGLYTVEVLDE